MDGWNECTSVMRVSEYPHVLHNCVNYNIPQIDSNSQPCEEYNYRNLFYCTMMRIRNVDKIIHHTNPCCWTDMNMTNCNVPRITAHIQYCQLYK